MNVFYRLRGSHEEQEREREAREGINKGSGPRRARD